MNDFDPEQLPPDLTDLGERLTSSRPVPSREALDRVMTRAQRAERGRGSLLHRSRNPAGKRTLATVLIGVALSLGVVGTASAITVSLAGLGPTLIADIKAKLHITAGPASVDVVIDDPAQAQYLGGPCLSALVTLGQLQAGVIINQLTVTLQEGVVEVLCGVAPPQRRLTPSTSSLNFGSVPDGTNSASQTVTFTNTGNASLSITGPTISPLAQFQITGSTCTLLRVLDVGETCTVSVRFSPLITIPIVNPAGNKYGTLSVISTAPTANVGLAGKAT